MGTDRRAPYRQRCLRRDSGSLSWRLNRGENRENGARIRPVRKASGWFRTVESDGAGAGECSGQIEELGERFTERALRDPHPYQNNCRPRERA